MFEMVKQHTTTHPHCCDCHPTFLQRSSAQSSLWASPGSDASLHPAGLLLCHTQDLPGHWNSQPPVGPTVFLEITSLQSLVTPNHPCLAEKCLLPHYHAQQVFQR